MGENFRTSCSSLLKLSEELRPYIEGTTTRMKRPVDVIKNWRGLCTTLATAQNFRLVGEYLCSVRQNNGHEGFQDGDNCEQSAKYLIQRNEQT